MPCRPICVETLQSLDNGTLQIPLMGIVTIPQILTLKNTPVPFNVVQLRRKRRQPLHRKPAHTRCKSTTRYMTPMGRPIVQNNHHLPGITRLGTITSFYQVQQTQKIRSALGSAHMSKKLARPGITSTRKTTTLYLPRSFNPQIHSSSCPRMHQIRDVENVRFIHKQKNDVSSKRLKTTNMQSQPNALKLACVALASDAMTHPTPAIPPFLRAARTVEGWTRMPLSFST
jgi:hypothetical protein